MQFNSYFFIILFLPVCVIGYYLLNRFSSVLGMVYLLGMSLWFYGYFNRSYLLLIVCSIGVNFGLSKIIERNTSYVKKGALILGILFNLGMIFYFKYFDFFIQNVNRTFDTDFNLKYILLPLGISFFTFQQLSYILDSYCGKTGTGGITLLNMHCLLPFSLSLWPVPLYCMMN